MTLLFLKKKKRKNFCSWGRKFFARLFFKKAAFTAFVLLSACATPPPPVIPYGPIALGVAHSGWHTEIVVPRAGLTGPLATLGPAALDRRYLVIGFGARGFFTTPDAGLGLAVEALFPGPSAINLSAFNNLTEESGIVWLHVSRADTGAILGFVWRSLPHHGALPRPIVTANDASMFYAARPDYSALYNCNNWTIAALRAGGLPFTESGVHFAANVMGEARRAAAAQQAQADQISLTGPP